jgi:branched-chain amino acid transport system permease protein
MTPTHFALETSAMPMLMVIMGGGATLWGPALGAAAIILIQNYAGMYLSDRWPLILGVMYVLCVLFLNGGFARYINSLWYKIGGYIVPSAGKAAAASVSDPEGGDAI